MVHAVLFFSPGCSHCRYVIQEALPPIIEEYRNQLNIIGVDVSQPDGQALFQAAIQRFDMESGPVPTLIVGEVVLIGSVDIPKKLPGLIEKYLVMGGVGWPDIPGLVEALSAVETSQAQTALPSSTQTTPSHAFSTPDSSATVAPASTPTVASLILTSEENNNVWGRISRDPVGNTLAIIVLIGMVASVIAAILVIRRTPGTPLSQAWSWAIPALCLLGVGIAGYLTYVEMAEVSAVCGPVGDCNMVQQSEYARLFGVLPIGVLGIAGYVSILLSWCIERYSREQWGVYARLALFGMAALGTLFSIYLTFLELFVIGATCAWCLTSAVLMTALLWLTIFPGRLALSTLLRKPKEHPILDEQRS